MPRAVTPQRAALARRLRDLRLATFPSGSALARQLGWPQTKVSKLETGRQGPTDDDLTAWATATRATRHQADDLFALLSASRVEYATFGQLYNRHGAVADQGRTAAEDRASARILQYQPSMVPGMVQTPAYAREVLSLACGPSSSGASAEDIEAIVGQRMERQHILYEPRHRIQIVMGEAALHTRFGTLDTLLGQLDRLTSVVGLAGVDLGVIPFSTPLPVFPLTGFIVYDDHVLIESITAQQRLDSADEVVLYAQFYSQLRDAAVSGAEAVALIRQVAVGLRV